MKSSDLFTRAVANDGRRVNIPAPDGKETGEWLHIHHVDCDAFRQKRADVLPPRLSLAAMQPRLNAPNVTPMRCWN